jgi:tRNA(Ile)-lysidine synthase
MSSALLDALLVLPPRLLVGVSGGVDSCALLHALCQTNREIIVLHYNHRWRRESVEEAKFVQALAKKYKVPFVFGKTKGRVLRTESAARAARFAFFAASAQSYSCSTLALAHHADDQVETFLLQLFRGGGSGAFGMASAQAFPGYTVRRPFLNIWRRHILAYAKEYRLEWVEDASNLERTPLRNRVRLELLPLLRSWFGESVPQRLVRTTEILQGQHDWIAALVAPLAQLPQLKVDELRPLPIGQQRAILQAWLQAQGVSDITFAVIENVRRLLTQERPSRCNLARSWWVQRSAGQLEIMRPPSPPP